jgi:glycosyltransferase involved in cell wall biosynthesis
MINVTFVMEQQVGHRSFYQNLRRAVASQAEIAAQWVEVTYEQTGGWWERLAVLPARIRGALSGRAQVRHGLRQTPYDVAVFNTQVPAAVSVPLPRQPYILCTDITPVQYDRMGAAYHHQRERLPALDYLKDRLNRRVFKQAFRILPWSTWTRASLIDDYQLAPSRLEVLPPGIDLSQWRPEPHPTNGPLRVLFVGGDWQRKGGEDLLRAFHSLPAGTLELVLVTKTVVPTAPGIRIYNQFEPNSAELIALCQTCDVMALPTYAEAFGIAAIEASALGLPTIATQVGGLPDIVSDQETGFLIKPGDWQALAQYLQMLAQNEMLRRQMSIAARQRAEQHFDATKNAARLAEVICEASRSTRP